MNVESLKRRLFVAGRLGPKAAPDQGFCSRCNRTVVLSNVREWPGENMSIGECRCGNTVVAYPDMPESGPVLEPMPFGNPNPPRAA